MTKKISIGDFVWAKVEGYHWWPGMVKSQKRNLFEIQFFGDFSRAFLSSKSIKDLNDESLKAGLNEPEMELCFEQIELIQSGKSTVEAEIKKIDEKIKEKKDLGKVI